LITTKTNTNAYPAPLQEERSLFLRCTTSAPENTKTQLVKKTSNIAVALTGVEPVGDYNWGVHGVDNKLVLNFLK